jgi:trk system potassium uptake protein TrkH
MNYRIILKIIGRVAAIEAAFMLIPLGVALYYKESIKGFLAAIAVALAFAGISALLTRKCDKKFFSKEGLTSVAASWVVISLIGALPFVVEGEIPNYIDAVFETISGFTTTGSTILTDIEVLSRGILFWRSLTHWIGGMGILVFMMAVVPMSEDYSMYIMRAEISGPESGGKLTAKVQHSSLILYLIYIFLTIVEVVALLLCKLPLYDSLIHAMGTAGTGGFSVKNASIGAYNSVSAEMVIALFMFLFGVNFNIYFFILLRRLGAAVKNEELRCYFGITVFATLTIAYNIRPLYDSFLTALRYSVFQVTSISSTTGFSTADFDQWPQYSKTVLMILMLMGACAGSTTGGMKMSRIMIVFKTARVEIKHMLHPRSFNPVRIEGKAVQKETLRSTVVFFSLYIIIIAVASLLVSFENKDFVTSFTSVTTCISNVGPGFSLIGPTGNFSIFSPFSKIVLSVCMLMGRLELFPILILFYPSTWKKRGQF